MSEYVALLIALGAAVLTARAACCNLRHWGQARHLPHVRATPAELASLRSTWLPNADMWPPPVRERNDPAVPRNGSRLRPAGRTADRVAPNDGRDHGRRRRSVVELAAGRRSCHCPGRLADRPVARAVADRGSHRRRRVRSPAVPRSRPPPVSGSCDPPAGRGMD